MRLALRLSSRFTRLVPRQIAPSCPNALRRARVRPIEEISVRSRIVILCSLAILTSVGASALDVESWQRVVDDQRQMFSESDESLPILQGETCALIARNRENLWAAIEHSGQGFLVGQDKGESDRSGLRLNVSGREILIRARDLRSQAKLEKLQKTLAGKLSWVALPWSCLSDDGVDVFVFEDRVRRSK